MEIVLATVLMVMKGQDVKQKLVALTLVIIMVWQLETLLIIIVLVNVLYIEPAVFAKQNHNVNVETTIYPLEH